MQTDHRPIRQAQGRPLTHSAGSGQAVDHREIGPVRDILAVCGWWSAVGGHIYRRAITSLTAHHRQ